MFLRLLLFLSIFLRTLSASEITVQSRHGDFQLKFDNKSIKISSKKINLSLKKDKCNQHQIDNFNWNIKNILNYRPLQKTKMKNSFNFTYKGEKFYTRYDSKVGVNLLLIPQKVHKLKLTEKFLCN